jgi:hypothetical protein
MARYKVFLEQGDEVRYTAFLTARYCGPEADRETLSIFISGESEKDVRGLSNILLNLENDNIYHWDYGSPDGDKDYIQNVEE